MCMCMSVKGVRMRTQVCLSVIDEFVSARACACISVCMHSVLHPNNKSNFQPIGHILSPQLTSTL